MQDLFEQLLNGNEEEFYKAVREIYAGLPTYSRIPKKQVLPLLRLIFFNELVKDMESIQKNVDNPYSIKIDEQIDIPKILHNTIETYYKLLIGEEGKGREEFVKMITMNPERTAEQESRGLLKKIFKRT